MQIFKEEVTFLGNIILKDGHAVLPDKAEAIRSWATPQTQKELRSFLGFVTFLKKFSPAISQLAAPLHPLAGKNAVFHWTPTHQQEFEALKEIFVSPQSSAMLTILAPLLCRAMPPMWPLALYSSRSMMELNTRWPTT